MCRKSLPYPTIVNAPKIAITCAQKIFEPEPDSHGHFFSRAAVLLKRRNSASLRNSLADGMYFD